MKLNDLKKKIDEMNLSMVDFQLGLGKIEAFFDKNFNEAPRNWLFKQVKYFKKDEWIPICEAAGGAFERAPAVHQLMNVFGPKIREAKGRRVKYINNMYRQQGLAQCNFCDHTGILDARIKNQPTVAPFAFRCTKCDFHELLDISKTIDLWDERLANLFELRHRRKMDAKDIMWRDIYRHGGGMAGLRKAMAMGPEAVHASLKLDKTFENSF